MDIIKDSRTVSEEILKNKSHARLLHLEECLTFFASPDTGLPLQMSSCATQLTDGTDNYELRENLPILMPAKLKPYFTDRLQVPYAPYQDAFLQYYLLASIKQSGEINALPIEQAAQKHFFRMADFLSDSKGLVLDVGCDDPSLGASLFPACVDYIGLDPFCTRLSPFRVIGVGEYLPFSSNTLDGVVFNTSLDHILDWRRAISEAKRVLKKNGSIYISTYIWSDRADLITDLVHFHHFRHYELISALEELNFTQLSSQIYESPKGDSHRHGLYLKAYKK
jgi:SAM-dependent methyltransferase